MTEKGVEVRVVLLLEGDHELRNVGSLLKLEKASYDSLLEPPEGTQPCQHLDFSPHKAHFQTSDLQNYKIIR